MKDIKKMLINSANKQEIHDLSADIIKNVDTSKVSITIKETSYKRPMFKISALIATLTTVVVLALVLSIGVFKTNGEEKNTIPDDSEIVNELPEETVIISDYAKQAYNLANIAINLMETELNSISSYFEESEEIEVVNALNPYIKNIEDILNNVELEFKVGTISNSDISYFENLLNISANENTFKFYYSEKLEYEKNEGKENYKSYSTVTGLIVCEELNISYSVTGEKRVKNGQLITKMDIELTSTDILSLEERASIDGSEYKYIFKMYKDLNLDKEVMITPRNLSNGERSVYFEYNEENITLYLDNNQIVGDFKSRENDQVFIYYNENSRIYKFKNSERIYTK